MTAPTTVNNIKGGAPFNVYIGRPARFAPPTSRGLTATSAMLTLRAVRRSATGDSERGERALGPGSAPPAAPDPHAGGRRACRQPAAGTVRHGQGRGRLRGARVAARADGPDA